MIFNATQLYDIDLTEPAARMKFWAPVFVFPTRIQNELIRSSSEKLPIWKFFIKKLFVFYLCLKENGAQCLIAAAYDCLLGPGAGSIFVTDYDYFVTFGPYVFIPSMIFIMIILGVNAFTNGGLAIICSSLLIG